MNDGINSFLLVYAGLFPIVNPIGGAPIFLGMTRLTQGTTRAALARRVALNGFLLLVGSLFVGSHVLEFFGITLPIVRVAGGLVVTAFAWQMLHSGNDIDTPALGPVAPPAKSMADAFYPLTMPLTVGPGSISVAIALGSQRGTTIADFPRYLLVAGGAVAGLAAIALTIYVCYRFAEPIVGFLGATGTSVVVRLSAFLLLCIGIDIIWNGASALIAR